MFFQFRECFSEIYWIFTRGAGNFSTILLQIRPSLFQCPAERPQYLSICGTHCHVENMRLTSFCVKCITIAQHDTLLKTILATVEYS